jgi:asparagine synthetase B (glutamine-hydrolysing)
LPEAQVRAQFEELLVGLVRLRRIADVPVGAFLSGGA